MSGRDKGQASRGIFESPGIAWTIFGVGLLGTLLLWRTIAGVERERAIDRLDSRARQVESEIARRLDAYVQLLRGAEGLFAASVQVDRGEWHAYVEKLHMHEAHPLLRNVVFIQRIPADELATHEAEMRAEGRPSYRVHPPGQRGEYFPTVYREPSDADDASLVGFDAGSQPVRREAMARARDLGVPTASGALTLLLAHADQGVARQGIGLFVPIFRHGAPRADVTSRRAALIGYVATSFRLDSFIDGALEGEYPVEVRLYLGETPTPQALLFDSAPGQVGRDRGDLSKTVTVPVPGGEWTLRFDADEKKLQATSQANAMLAIGFVFNLLLFLLVTSQMRMKQRAATLARQATADLEHSHAELEASLKEKDVLLAEVHHRVKNNLQVISSLIQMQARRVGDKASAEALTECRGRVNAIALIHEKLYESGEVANLGFHNYVRSLVDGIVQAARFPNQLVRVEVEVPDIRVPVERAIPCGLLLNELVTNALEHAYPDGRAGTVRVTLREEAGGRMVLSVSDDGIGLPPELEPSQSPSLGLRLVSALASQLKARLVVVRNPVAGTTFSVVIAANDKTLPPSSSQASSRQPSA
jgi:two-component sensor histidine kinase